LPKWKNKWEKDKMKNLIKKILREEFGSKEIRNLYWGGLSDEDKKDIKEKGNKVFSIFGRLDKKKFNEKLKKHGLYYGPPDKEYIEKNIADIIFATKNLPLKTYTRNNLIEKKDLLGLQLESIEKFERKEIENVGPYFTNFYELPNTPEEKKRWSTVNLFNNNIMVWMRLINDWLNTDKKTEKSKSVSGIIEQYFGMEDGKMALNDLSQTIIDRNKDHIKNITTHTWGGGQEIEKKFVTQLIKNKKFTQDDIHVFSGEKNIVDGVGIDLAVLCEGSWVPIQVKSDESEARKYIPYGGFGTFPSGDTFILIPENKIQMKLSEFCKSEDVPVEDISVNLDKPEDVPVKSDKPVRGVPPSSSDYIGWLEKQK
jgi:hypothetical protein